MERQIVILGTGSALPARNYHACFVISTESFTLLSDAGGGNGIITQLKAAGIAPTDITHFVLSHSHTDHIFGGVWLIRVLINQLLNGVDIVPLHVYANRATAHALVEICRLTFLDSYFSKLNSVINLHIVDAPERDALSDSVIDFFDVGSENVEQMGFKITFDDQTTVVSLGDEALTEANCHQAKNADYLISGAFCRYADREIFRPYEKHHFTVKDVAERAAESDIKTLILYHSEDKTTDKQRKYQAEAAEFFSGQILIPYDLDVIEF